MSRISTTQWIVVFCLAFAVNATILGLIPMLSQDNTRCESGGYCNPILINVYKPPPVSRPEEKRKILPKVAMKPKKIPVVTLQKTSVRRSKPRINLSVNAFQFDVNPKLETGIEIAPPPEEPRLQTALSSKEFGLGEVDQIPKLIRRVEPIYPYSARIKGITGKVIVKFLVDSKGYARKPVILKATPKGVFEETVLQAVRKWKFKPGYWQGHPVATWVVVPIQFKLSG